MIAAEERLLEILHPQISEVSSGRLADFFPYSPGAPAPSS
jgi:hypothetical protein